MPLSLKAMIIEDNPDDLTLLLIELKKGGYDPVYEVVDDASSMKAALQWQAWDIILCDFKLPQFNGLEALKILQKSGLDLPFIVVSGYIGEDTAVEVMKAGVHDVIMKSNLKRLIPAVNRELQEAVNRSKRRKAEEALALAKKELEHSNELLKQYGHKITQAQEAERKRIAYELHDDTAQYLSILKLEIEALINSGEIQSPEVLDKLEYLKKDAERAFNDVRRYSHELRPGVLEHLGLYAALEQIAEDINKLKQVPVELHIEGNEPHVSEDIKLAFFRIAQEAINNARKHAKATLITINLKFNHHKIIMMVSDNGIGFNSKKALERSGSQGSLGLMSMRERANLINADLMVKSEQAKGTQVILKSKI